MPTKSSVLDSLERVPFKEDEILFNRGENSFFFYIIEEGEVEIFLPAQNGKEEVHLAVAGPGEPIGEFALIVKKPRSASARAITAGVAIRVSEKGYQSLLEDLPTWVVRLLENVIERINNNDERIR